MMLPALRKQTDADVHLSHLLDLDARMHLLVVIKARFRIQLDGKLQREPGAEVRTTDKLWDEDKPEQSSLEHSSDLCLRKPAADIVCKGDAMAPGREPQRQLDVLLRVGPVERALRVFGQRVWYKGMTELAPTPPEPFVSMPLKWELAFGGRDSSSGALVEEPRNPVGKGLTGQPASLVHQPVANIEDPADLIKNAASRPRPAGLAPIMRHWAPRKLHAGTHDATWLRERVPLQPLDFDARHNQIAPPELIYPGYLSGGEQVDLFHLCEHAAALRFFLPKLSFYVGADAGGGQITEHRPVCDTLILEPNDLIFDLVYRCSIPLSLTHELRSVQVHERKVLP